jgi:uncharacterized protein
MNFSNRLIKETSPYLLQHAHNPVDWFPWGDEALQKAKEEDKPILISIGYSSCHWCHVMERESFEDVTTANIMNQHFINIKIDREERPDLDHIYMDAVQAMSGSGGWPLNVFLTPDLKPFYGGTYYPPVRAYNRSSWKEVLHGIVLAFKEKRSEIMEQATELTNHMQNANSFGTDKAFSIDLPKEELFFQKQANDMFDAVMKNADRSFGGFGNAPKFPQTFTINYLLQYYFFTKSAEALQQACLSLDKMIEGGIYDHVGGGFARYSTDAEWLAPHFEKMLYDNALLVCSLSDAYQLTHKQSYFRAIQETLLFVEREMTSPENGFYSALDADSEGVEGKYYTWTKQEVDAVLGNNAELFCSFYDITDHGNWEEVNIPRIKTPAPDFCRHHLLNEAEFDTQMKSCLQQLYVHRNKRIRPLLDDKIILSWNALMNTAYSKAFAATGNEAYRKKAIANMEFLLQAFGSDKDVSLQHVWKNNTAKFPAFLDDYAFLIQALLQLQEITSNFYYIEKAGQLTEYVISAFSEDETGYFFYTPQGQQDIIFRKKEVYDGAVPSGNAVMSSNLYQLGILFNRPEWVNRSVLMLGALSQPIIRYPSSFGVWAAHMLNLIYNYNEIAVVGKDYEEARDKLLELYIPGKILQAAADQVQSWPLLANKRNSQNCSFYYLCTNYSCKQPVQTTADFYLLIKEGRIKQ